MREYLAEPGPIAFAHRGGAEEAPENTLPAFAAAVALGFRYLETDVHLTADKVLVAFHDSRLDRVTDRTSRIAQLPLATVQAADAGYWFSSDGGMTFPFRGKGVAVPTLEQLLTSWPSARVNIDPKADDCAAPLVALLSGLGAFERVCVASFSDHRLARIRSLSRGGICTPMGRLASTAAWAASRTGSMPRLRADCIQVPLRSSGVRVVDSRFVRAAHRAGLPVHVWTINDAPTMHALLDLGVDGIMSDRPRLLKAVLMERGQWPNGGAVAAKPDC